MKIANDVDRYLAGALLGADPVMDGVLMANRRAGLPSIDVSPLQGKLLALLARLVRAQRILEIGTLGGYSTIWMARALPDDGRIVTLESEPAHAKVARANFLAAGLADRIELIEGAAGESLRSLAGAREEPYDLVFIDADKPSNTIYLDWAAKLARKGALIILDNVVRAGDVLDGASEDERVQGSRAGIEMLGTDPRFDATAVQTVGEKGYDGFALAVVR